MVVLTVRNPRKICSHIVESGVSSFTLDQLYDVMTFAGAYSDCSNFSTDVEDAFFIGSDVHINFDGSTDEYLIGLTKRLVFCEFSPEEVRENGLQDIQRRVNVLNESPNPFSEIEHDTQIQITIADDEISSCKILSKVLQDRDHLTYEELEDCLTFKYEFYNNYTGFSEDVENLYFIGFYSANYLAMLTKGEKIFLKDLHKDEVDNKLPPSFVDSVKTFIEDSKDNNEKPVKIGRTLVDDLLGSFGPIGKLYEGLQ